MTNKEKEIIFKKVKALTDKITKRNLQNESVCDDSKVDVSNLILLSTLLNDLNIGKEFQEWCKEQETIEKELAELPKSYVRIDKSDIEGETEKAYKLYVGNNGYISRGLYKAFYKWIPKSKCKIINNEIYAPFWAVK